jgi:hypothetical protein
VDILKSSTEPLYHNVKFNYQTRLIKIILRVDCIQQWTTYTSVLNPTEPASVLSRIRNVDSWFRRSIHIKLFTKKINGSVLHSEVLKIFQAAIKSPLTRDVYEMRLLNFLGYLKMSPEDF